MIIDCKRDICGHMFITGIHLLNSEFNDGHLLYSWFSLYFFQGKFIHFSGEERITFLVINYWEQFFGQSSIRLVQK